ncbi:MAG: hypothetical protein P4L50_09730 [Anaerolineaceae bacterium]|nr:hypothetical protein [Anaerolineaceae bacterium]
MKKYYLLSAALSLFAIALLPIHHFFVQTTGNANTLDMAFGLPIGLATAVNLDVIINKINGKKK